MPALRRKTATPDNLASFSAVGFFVAQQLHRATQVPIALVTLPVGGSPASFRQFLADDAKAWSQVIRTNNISLD